MANGTISCSVNNEYTTGRIVWESTSNTSTRTASVTAKFQIKKTATEANATNGTCNITITVNGSSGSYSKSVKLYTGAGWVTVGSRTVSVSYGSSTTKSITISASGSIPHTTITSISGSGTAKLDTIPSPEPEDTASTVSANNCTINGSNKVNISITRAKSSYTHNLTYSFGGHSGTIATGVATTYSWTPPTSLRDTYCTDAMSKICTITCVTKNGSTTVGTTTKNITLSVPTYDTPVTGTVTVTLEPVNTNTVVAGWDIALQGYSKLKVTLTKTGLANQTRYGATLTGVVVWKDGEKIYDGTYSGFSNITTPVQTSAGTKSFSLWLTDSRGVSAKVWAQAIKVQEYSKPKLKVGSQFTAWRCDSSGTPLSEGTYLAGVITGSNVYPSNKNSVKQYRIGYSRSGVFQQSYTVSLNETKIMGPVDADETCTVIGAVVDQLDNRTDVTIQIPQALVTLNFAPGGKKGRFFGKAESSQPDNTMYIQTNRILTTADYSTTAWASVSYKTGYSDYSSSDAVKYRRVGDVVFVQGIATNAAEKTNTTDQDTHIVFTLPSGFRPSQRIQILTQFSNYTIGLITVKTNGNVSISRFRDGATGVNLVQGSWINLNFSFSI